MEEVGKNGEPGKRVSERWVREGDEMSVDVVEEGKSREAM